MQKILNRLLSGFVLSGVLVSSAFATPTANSAYTFVNASATSATLYTTQDGFFDIKGWNVTENNVIPASADGNGAYIPVIDGTDYHKNLAPITFYIELSVHAGGSFTTANLKLSDLTGSVDSTSVNYNGADTWTDSTYGIKDVYVVGYSGADIACQTTPSSSYTRDIDPNTNYKVHYLNYDYTPCNNVSVDKLRVYITETSSSNSSAYNFNIESINLLATSISAPTPVAPAGNTVTFDANGGSGSMSAQSASVATNLTSNTLTRSGYIFTGWNTLANGSGTAYADGASYAFGANITLYAQWSAVPTITSVSVPSNGSYKALQNLTFTVNTSENVTVSGNPRLVLDVGGTPKYATYVSGSGTSALTFTYTVGSGANDSDGISVSSLDLNGGTIQNGSSTNLTTTLVSVGATTSVKVDTTTPTLSSVTIASSNATTSKAKENDVITLSFTASEALGSAPSVTINGTTVTASNTGGNAYTATYTVQAGDSGAITYSIPFSDTAGNAGTAVTTTTNSSSVTMDTSTPTLSAITIASDNATSTKAMSGDIITVSFTASETLATPTVTIAGQSATVTNTSGNNYTATYQLNGSESDGASSFSIAFSDPSGNAGTNVTTVSSGSGVTIDNTAPTVSTYSPANGATTAATNADIVLTFGENISAGTGNILIKKTSDNSIVQSIAIGSATISGTTLTINPSSDFSTSTSYYIEIASGVIKDSTGNDYAGIVANAYNFTTSNAVAAPLLSGTPAGGSVDNTTKVTATAGGGNTLQYKVSSTSIATPNTGDAVSGLSLSPYTSGADISGVDRDTNKYVGIYEVDGSGNVVKFVQYTLTKSTINMPSAPTLTTTVSQGSANGTTKASATAGGSNTLAYKVSSTSIPTPDVGDIPTGTTSYTSGADISGVDATTNKYLGVYELDSNGEVVKFYQKTLTSSDIKSTPAPALVVFPASGSVDETTKFTATPTSGNTLAYKVSSTSIPTPNVGDTPTGTTAYTSGADIPNVDRTTNKYLGMYELDSSGNVVNFTQITLTKSTINMPSAPILITVINQGSTTGTTKASATPTSGNTLAYKVSSTSIPTPDVGDVPTGTTSYTSGADISGVDDTTNKYLGVYELDSNGEVVKFYQKTLSANDIKSSSTPQLSISGNTGGSSDNTTKFTATPSSGNHIAYKVSTTSIATPTVGSQAVGTTNYTSGSDIVGVDRNTSKYLGVYELDSSGNVVKFTQIILTKSEINMPQAPQITASASAGSAQNTTKVTASASSGNTLAYKVSNTSIPTPDVGDIPTGTTSYTSGSNITGVDATSNKYVGIYELDSNGEVVNFKEIVLSANEINTTNTTQDDKKAVLGVNNILKIGLMQNLALDSLVSDISLDTSAYASYGTTISWASSDTNAIAISNTTGVVTRGNTDTEVTITATITKGTFTFDKKFKVKVLKALTNAEGVEKTKNGLIIGHIIGDNSSSIDIKTDLTQPLPSSGVDGATISWASSDTSIISNSGVVTRPQNDTIVKMSATITKGGVTEVKEFNMIVKGAKTSIQKLRDARDLLTIDKLLGANRNESVIVNDLNLDTTASRFGFDSGISVSFSTSANTITSSGVVSRPTNDETVTITATITDTNVTPNAIMYKTFTFNVKAVGEQVKAATLNSTTETIVNGNRTISIAYDESSDTDLSNTSAVVTTFIPESYATTTTTTSGVQSVLDNSNANTQVQQIITTFANNGVITNAIAVRGSASSTDTNTVTNTIKTEVLDTSITRDTTGSLLMTSNIAGTTATVNNSTSGVVTASIQPSGSSLISSIVSNVLGTTASVSANGTSTITLPTIRLTSGTEVIDPNAGTRNISLTSTVNATGALSNDYSIQAAEGSNDTQVVSIAIPAGIKGTTTVASADNVPTATSTFITTQTLSVNGRRAVIETAPNGRTKTRFENTDGTDVRSTSTTNLPFTATTTQKLDISLDTVDTNGDSTPDTLRLIIVSPLDGNIQF